MTLAVQTDDGRRATAQFSMQASLREVLRELQQDGKVQLPGEESGLVPVMILATNAEVRGEEELGRATLEGLGFGAGKRELLKLKFVDPAKEKKVSEENSASGASVAVSTPAEPRGDSPPRRAMRVDEGGSMLEKLVGKKEDDTAGGQEPRKKSKGSEDAKDKEEEEKMEVEEEEAVAETATRNPEEELEGEESDEEDGKAEDGPMVLNYVGEQNAVVYLADDLSSGRRKKKLRQPAESFFEVTVDEVKRRQRELKEETRRLEQGEQLLTRGVRDSQKEAEKLRVLGRYRKTVVRIQFPDRHVLQAAFLSGSKVSEVRDFVRRFLRPEAASANFDLFTAPPKTVLHPGSTLLDCHLVPMAMVHFGPKSKQTHPHFLKQEVLDKKSNEKGAVQAALEAGVERQKKAEEEEDQG